MKVTEIKRLPDGREESFTCDALYLTEALAVLRFQVPPNSNYIIHDTTIPPGSTTLAIFWQGTNCLVYKMIDSKGTLLGYRFDVCKDVDITTETVKWTDLVLDAWLGPSNQLVFLDEEEVAELTDKGIISQEDLETIASAKKFLSENYLQVIAKAEELLRTLA